MLAHQYGGMIAHRSIHTLNIPSHTSTDIRVEMDYTSNIKSIHSEAQASPSPASPICVHSDTVSSMEMTSPPLHVKSTDTESTVSIIAGGKYASMCPCLPYTCVGYLYSFEVTSVTKT